MGTIASCDRPGSLTWMWRWCLLSTQPSCTHWTLQWLVKFTPTFLTGGWNGGAVEGWRCGEVPWRRSKGQSASASPWTVEEPTQHRHHVCGQVGGACMCSVCPWIHCMWVLQWPMYCRSLPLPSPLKVMMLSLWLVWIWFSNVSRTSNHVLSSQLRVSAGLISH